MYKGIRFADEFKQDAVAQVVERGYAVSEMADRLGVTRDAARQDVFDYIEVFYNPTRKHTNHGMLSPVDHETEQKKMNEAGV